jgi:hypothetical protein
VSFAIGADMTSKLTGHSRYDYSIIIDRTD